MAGSNDEDYSRETQFIPKTDISKQIADIIKSSEIKTAFSEIKISFLIFGPGKKSPQFKPYRLALKNMIVRKKNQPADLPEEVDNSIFRDFFRSSDFRPSSINRALKNPVVREQIMMSKYDITIILLMSPGSISEYSIFFTKEDLAPKIRLYIPEKYAKSKSFIANGPVKAFKNVYKHVETFSSPEDLLKKVCTMVNDLLTYKLIASKYI